MTYNQFLLGAALITARAEKAIMRRQSRRASERRMQRAISRQSKKDRQDTWSQD